MPLSAARVSASARACAASAVRRDAVATSRLTTPADEQEDHQRDEVLALGDGELVERRREVPVGEQEAGDRAHERGDEAAERGDDHDDQQEDQQVARQRERARTLASTSVRTVGRGDREDPRQEPPPR